jgi:hypothetical protein
MAAGLLAPSRLAALLLLLVPALAPASPAQFQVHTVDSNGPADFAQLQPAIDAAAAGDLILLAPGGYEPAVLDGKGLAIVADGGFPAVIDTTGTFGVPITDPILTVRNVPADQACLIAGLTVFSGAAGPVGNLLVEDCAGPVWLQSMFLDSYGTTSLAVQASSSLVMVDGTAQTNLFPPLPDGTPVQGPGARIEQGSAVWSYGSAFTGSHGAFLPPGSPDLLHAPPGGQGAVVSDSTIRAWESQVSGSSGGSNASHGCLFGADGGAGLEISGASASAFFADGSPDGGFPGLFDPGCAWPPQMGPDIDGDPAAVTTATGVTRGLTAPMLAQVGETIELGLSGSTGESAWLFMSNLPGASGEVGGVDLHLQVSSLLLLAAVPMTSDELTLDVLVPHLPVGVEGVVVPLQAVFLGGAAGRQASNPWAVAVH